VTRRQQPEAAIQRALITHLRWRGVPNSFAFHPANGGWRTAVEGAILRSMGVVPGVPDIIIIHNGKVFGLELKTDNGRLTDIQRETLETMQRAGANVAVVYGLDQAIAQLEAWQLLRPDRNINPERAPAAASARNPAFNPAAKGASHG
jgi:VRR-NUC domain